MNSSFHCRACSPSLRTARACSYPKRAANCISDDLMLEPTCPHFANCNPTRILCLQNQRGSPSSRRFDRRPQAGVARTDDHDIGANWQLFIRNRDGRQRVEPVVAAEVVPIVLRLPAYGGAGSARSRCCSDDKSPRVINQIGHQLRHGTFYKPALVTRRPCILWRHKRRRRGVAGYCLLSHEFDAACRQHRRNHCR